MIYTTPQTHREGAPEVHPSQRQAHITPINSPLYVVTAVSNPQRFRTRYELYRAFEKRVIDAGAIPYTVELALRDRHFEVTEADNPRHIQLRSPAELWHKENLLNLGIRALPSDWQYVAWIDADVSFARPDWVQETLHQLQHYHILQLWSHAQDLGPNNEPIGITFESFLSSIANGEPMPGYLADTAVGLELQATTKSEACPYPPYAGASADVKARWSANGHKWHSGYAWAARRSAISDLGGLGDVAVLGSSDHHMAAALIGKVERTIHGRMNPNYLRYWQQWQARAMKFIKGNVGYVPGLLLHHFHGAKRHRRYVDRWSILVDNQYNPETDITRDVQGLLQLTGENLGLRDGIRSYFRQRNEDSIEVD